MAVLAFVIASFTSEQRLKGLLLLLVMVTYMILSLSKQYNNNVSMLRRRQSMTRIEEIVNSSGSYKYSVFFFESNYEREELTTKEMCAIESAAKSNPNALVQLHTYSATLGDKAAALLKIYPNLKVIRFEPEKIFNGTSLLAWWLDKAVFGSNFAYAHLADAFRLAALWKYGGIYSDLDTITVKSFEGLFGEGKSGFGDMKEHNESIGTGVLIFRAAKHPFLAYIIDRFSNNYTPDIWGANGPTLFIESAMEFCEIDNIHVSLFDDSTQNGNRSVLNCADLRIFPQVYFYPFLYVNGEHGKIFEKDCIGVKLVEYKKKIVDSYSLHYFGALSSQFQPKPNDMSFFSYLAANHCDFTFNYVREANMRFY